MKALERSDLAVVKDWDGFVSKEEASASAKRSPP